MLSHLPSSARLLWVHPLTIMIFIKGANIHSAQGAPERGSPRSKLHRGTCTSRPYIPTVDNIVTAICKADQTDFQLLNQSLKQPLGGDTWVCIMCAYGFSSPLHFRTVTEVQVVRFSIKATWQLAQRKSGGAVRGRIVEERRKHIES